MTCVSVCHSDVHSAGHSDVCLNGGGGVVGGKEGQGRGVVWGEGGAREGSMGEGGQGW